MDIPTTCSHPSLFTDSSDDVPNHLQNYPQRLRLSSESSSFFRVFKGLRARSTPSFNPMSQISTSDVAPLLPGHIPAVGTSQTVHRRQPHILKILNTSFTKSKSLLKSVRQSSFHHTSNTLQPIPDIGPPEIPPENNHYYRRRFATIPSRLRTRLTAFTTVGPASTIHPFNMTVRAVRRRESSPTSIAPSIPEGHVFRNSRSEIDQNAESPPTILPTTYAYGESEITDDPTKQSSTLVLSCIQTFDKFDSRGFKKNQTRSMPMLSHGERDYSCSNVDRKKHQNIPLVLIPTATTSQSGQLSIKPTCNSDERLSISEDEPRLSIDSFYCAGLDDRMYRFCFSEYAVVCLIPTPEYISIPPYECPSSSHHPTTSILARRHQQYSLPPTEPPLCPLPPLPAACGSQELSASPLIICPADNTSELRELK